MAFLTPKAMLLPGGTGSGGAAAPGWPGAWLWSLCVVLLCLAGAPAAVATPAAEYQIKAAYSGRIKNPGYSSASRDICEKLCNSLGIAVFYMNGGPL